MATWQDIAHLLSVYQAGASGLADSADKSADRASERGENALDRAAMNRNNSMNMATGMLSGTVDAYGQNAAARNHAARSGDERKLLTVLGGK